jgi:hypothetical protein
MELGSRSAPTSLQRHVPCNACMHASSKPHDKQHAPNKAAWFRAAPLSTRAHAHSPHARSEGGFFNARLTFPKDYPNSPPQCRFLSDMWHPNGVYACVCVCVCVCAVRVLLIHYSLHPFLTGPVALQLNCCAWQGLVHTACFTHPYHFCMHCHSLPPALLSEPIRRHSLPRREGVHLNPPQPR